MSRKDYEALAAKLAETADYARRLDEASEFTSPVEIAIHAILGVAEAFTEDNPRFDRTKFLAACGVTL